MKKMFFFLGAGFGCIGPFLLYPFYMFSNFSAGKLLLYLWPFSICLIGFHNEPLSAKAIIIILGLGLLNVALFSIIGFIIAFALGIVLPHRPK